MGWWVGLGGDGGVFVHNPLLSLFFLFLFDQLTRTNQCLERVMMDFSFFP